MRSMGPLTDLGDASRLGDEGAAPVWIELRPAFAEAVTDLASGSRIILLTWLDQARRDVLRISPRGDTATPTVRDASRVIARLGFIVRSERQGSRSVRRCNDACLRQEEPVGGGRVVRPTVAFAPGAARRARPQTSRQFAESLTRIRCASTWR